MKISARKALTRFGIAPMLAAAVLVPSAAMAQTAPEPDPTEAAEAPTVEVPSIEDIELPDIPESSFEVTAEWGEGEVITDVSGEGDGTGDGDDDDPIEPDQPDDGDDGKDDDEGDDPQREDCDVDAGATEAEKVVLVDGTDGPNATVQTCEKDGDGYVEVESYDGKVGFEGIAEAGEKREGDGMTPSGTWALEEGFGISDKPTSFAGDWTTVQDGDVWVDNSDSEHYNEYVKAADVESADTGEDLFAQKTAYNYAQVVDYNRPAEADLGSAIFLHVHTGGGSTAGCISVTEDELLDIFEWQGDTDTDMQITQ